MLKTERENKLLDRSTNRQSHASSFGVTDLWLLLTALIWGTNYAVTKFALEDFLPLAFSGPRFLIAALCLAAALLFTGRGFKVERQHLLPMLFFGVSAVAINQSLFTIGLSYTKAGNAALILAMSPIFTAIISRARRQEFFSARGIVGLFVAFAGLTLIILSSKREVSFGEGLKGDLLLLVAAVFWSIYTIGVGRYAHIYGSMKSATMMLLLGTPILLLVSTPTMLRQNWASIRPISWAGMIASGVLSLAVSFIIWNHGVKKLGATRTAIYSYVQPVFAMLAAYPMVGEVPTPGQAAGAVVVLLGIYLVRSGTTAQSLTEKEEESEEEISLGLSNS